MTTPPCPNGLAEIVRTFGDSRKYLRSDGTLSPNWEHQHIVRIDLPAPLRLDFLPGDNEPLVKRITAHKLIAPHLGDTLRLVHAAGLWDGLGGFSGGFAWRPQRGSRKISTHAWGLAWDFGASRDKLGDAHGGPDPDMPLAIVDIFEAAGFTWGGRWKRADQMHFQWAAGY